MKHATACSPAVATSSGSVDLHMSVAKAHRLANRQPGSGDTNSGTVPSMALSLPRSCEGRWDGGQQATSVRMLGIVKDLFRVAHLDDLARVHHRGPITHSTDQRQVMTDI